MARSSSAIARFRTSLRSFLLAATMRGPSRTTLGHESAPVHPQGYYGPEPAWVAAQRAIRSPPKPLCPAPPPAQRLALPPADPDQPGRQPEDAHQKARQAPVGRKNLDGHREQDAISGHYEPGLPMVCTSLHGGWPACLRSQPSWTRLRLPRTPEQGDMSAMRALPADTFAAGPSTAGRACGGLLGAGPSRGQFS